MAYGVITRVRAPVEAYDAVHAAFLRRGGEAELGLIAHVGRPTSEGFETIEIWESREQYDHLATVVLPAILAEVMRDAPPPADMDVEEFEVRGLVVPGAAIRT